MIKYKRGTAKALRGNEAEIIPFDLNAYDHGGPAAAETAWRLDNWLLRHHKLTLQEHLDVNTRMTSYIELQMLLRGMLPGEDDTIFCEGLLERLRVLRGKIEERLEDGNEAS